MKKRSGLILKTKGDIAFNIINITVMLLIIIITIYPFLNILAISLNDARDAAAGGIGIMQIGRASCRERVFQPV
jgi:ABC-type glycerol-3-phosphate transport system permease component